MPHNGILVLFAETEKELALVFAHTRRCGSQPNIHALLTNR